MPKRANSADLQLLLIVFGLVIFGGIMVYSASTVVSYKNFGNTSYYFVHQLAYGIVLGLLGMYLFSRIDYHFWQKFIPAAVVGALILLILVKVPGVGFVSGGASRWIKLGPLLFQPSEIAKLALIMYLSGWISRRGGQLKNFYFGFFPALVLTVLFAALILWQPDLGTMLVVAATAVLMFFAGGVKLNQLFWVLASGLLALAGLIYLEPYRLNRFTTFLNRSFDRLGISYQINQALIAIGSGGLWGYGYGLSRQKHNYLPESIGDSVFAVMAEELGFFRTLPVILLFLLFALRGIKISLAAPDSFGKILALGITSAITIQALINIGAIMGLLPLTGIPLPFFSYGSSSLIASLLGVGILLNISRQANLNK